MTKPVSRRHFFKLASSAAAVAGTATLVGCAGTSSTSSAPNSSNAGGAVTELTWWSNHPGKSKAVEEELIKRFEAANPEIKINLVDGGKNYEETAQKFNAALTGNNLPDIVVLSDVWWFNFAVAGQIVPIEDVASAAGIDTSTFVKSLYDDYLHGGKHYAMPFARSTPLFYYNKDVWQKAGLPDRGPETWEEMASWAPKIKAQLGEKQNAYVWASAAEYLAWTFEGPLWTFGGGYSDGWDLKFTDPNTIKAVTWLQQAAQSWAPISQNPATDFSAGLTASVILSTGDLTGIEKDAKFNVGTAFLPNPLGDGGCPTGGAGLAIPAGIPQERQVAAAKFIDFVTNAENTAYWSRNVGYMPVRLTSSEVPEQKEFLAAHPNYEVAVKQLPQTRSQDNARVFLPGADQKIGGALESICVGGADVTATLTSLQTTLQAIFDAQVKPRL